jgi:acyl-CoA reductase-like NAD-dependent aldehyde dehydrogenase
MRSPSSHPSIPSRELLKTWQKQLEGRTDEFLQEVEADTGRNQAESYLYDWMPLEGHFSFLADNANSHFSSKRLSSALNPFLGKRDVWQRRIPVGTVLVIGTWNFPLALQLSQILTALACGNKVVFKSSPWTPRLKELFEKVLPMIFGEGRFSVWKGTDEEVLDSVRRGDYQALIFTGATSVAKLYAEAASHSFCKCILEASGSEAALIHESSVLKDSDIRQWVDHLLWGLLHFNGQTCVAPRFWFVPESKLELVWAEIRKQMEDSVEVLEGRPQLRHEGIVEEFRNWTEWASNLEEDAEVFEPSKNSPCTFVKLKKLESLNVQSPPSFGPGAIIVPFKDFSSVTQWVQSSPWALMTQVFCESLSERDQRLLEQIETTIVSFGESIVSVGDAAVPFGGTRNSGLGVTHGIEGLNELTRAQTWVRAKTWPMTSAWMRPSWKNIPQLPKLVGAMRGMKSNPLKAVASFLGKEAN